MNIDEAINEFNNYTSNYDDKDNMIKLKINHTYRVVDYCKEIAESLNLDEEKINLSKLIGLLHDIGRFEQVKRYHTFSDKDSIDHANLGVDILKENNYIRKFISSNEYDDILLKSIENHNKYTISQDLNDDELLFSKLIRDADKIDILYLYTIKEVDLELDDKPFSDNVYNTLLKKSDVARKDLKSKTDRLSISLGFIFDINYKKSFEIIKEKDFFNIIIDQYIEKTNNNKLKEQLENIRKVISNYIEEMLGC